MGRTRSVDPIVKQYFAEPNQPIHRQYLALRRFLFDGISAETVASEFGYTENSVYTIARDFKAKLSGCIERGEDPFFLALKPGRKKLDRDDELVETIIKLRKKQFSIPDIKVFLDGKGYSASEGFIYKVCDEKRSTLT